MTRRQTEASKKDQAKLHYEPYSKFYYVDKGSAPQLTKARRANERRPEPYQGRAPRVQNEIKVMNEENKQVFGEGGYEERRS